MIQASSVLCCTCDVVQHHRCGVESSRCGAASSICGATSFRCDAASSTGVVLQVWGTVQRYKCDTVALCVVHSFNVWCNRFQVWYNRFHVWCSKFQVWYVTTGCRFGKADSRCIAAGTMHALLGFQFVTRQGVMQSFPCVWCSRFQA